MARRLSLLVLAGWAAVAMPAGAQTTPMIVSTTPAYLAQGVAPSVSVVITFSTAMDTNKTVAEFYAVSAPGVPLPVTNSWNTAHTQLTCTPNPPLPANTLILWSVTGADPLGTELAGQTEFMFMTGTGGPYVVSVVPANGATNVPPSTPVVFVFSAVMDTNATFAQFHTISAPATPLPVTTSWSTDHTRLTCTPNPAFPVGQMIFWTLVGQDPGGKMMQGASGTFQTPTIAPTLVSVNPTNQAGNIAPAGPVVFVFSTMMDTNRTAAQFRDAAAPLTLLPTVAAWRPDLITLTCTPAPSFPTNRTILWTLAGQDVMGVALGGTTNGSFATGSSNPPAPVAFALVSRGEAVTQTDTNLFEITGPEFVALASGSLSNGVSVTVPVVGGTRFLEGTGPADALEFRENFSSTASFVTNYPAGNYVFSVTDDDGAASASLGLTDDLLPAAPHLSNWQTPPFTVLGQPLSVQWDFASGGATADYVRLRLEQNGSLLFATPLAGSAGALNGASNAVVVSANLLTNLGRIEVSLTAFHFTAFDTNSIPGVTVRAAVHHTTTFEVRVVDGTLPPPLLLTTNLTGVPVGEPFLNPLLATNGVRPLRYELLSGTLPTGLVLETPGRISGQASAAGSFDASLRLTDLLGRSATQVVHFTTVPLPPDTARPRLQNVGHGANGTLVFDLVGAAGTNRFLERSADLIHWTDCLTTNPATDRITISWPASAPAAFFRARGAGLPFLTPKPLKVAPVLSTNVSASAQMDELGGSLSLTNSSGYVCVLNVPPGALDRTETITMTEISQIGGLPLSGGLRAAVDLQPEGLLFDVPARLDLTAPGPLDPAAVLGFGARSDGSQFALKPAFCTNRTVSLYLWHFSPAGMGNGTSADGAAQAQNAPEDPMTALAQQVAVALQACKADPSCSPDSISGELIQTYIQMADQVVILKLQKAVADDNAVDDGLRTWLNWLRDIELLGLFDGDLFGNSGSTSSSAELQKRIRRAGSLATQALRNAIDKACQRCLQHEVWRIYRMLELARMAALLGMDYGENEFFECARKCLVFELEVESEIVSSDKGIIYSTHTKGKAKLRPQTLGDGDPNTADMARLMLIFTGSGQWDVTELQHTEPGDCHVQATPASGRLEFPWVKIDLYKKRQVWVPGEGPVTSYVFQPDMTVKLRSGLPPMPKEKRIMVCPKAPPAVIPDIFPEMFNAFHNQEVVIPSGLGEDVLGGPVFNMTGFVPGGMEDVILSKPYLQTLGATTENTLIQLRHTPGK